MWLWWISLIVLALRLLLSAPPPEEVVVAFAPDPDFQRAEQTLGIEWRRFVRPVAGGVDVWRVELNLGDDLRAMATATVESAGDVEGAAFDDVALDGLALAALDRSEEAEAAFRELVRRRPRCVEARLMRGVVLAEMARWDEAAGEFRRAVRLAPACAEARMLAVAAERESGNATAKGAADAGAPGLDSQPAPR
jgi:tetratricopeptide (TPR) repeat protein